MKLETIFVEEIHRPLEEGKLYVSEKYNTSRHLCPCGCKNETVLPFVPGNPNKDSYWGYTNNGDGTVTFEPSIYNKQTCRAHYFIRNSEVQDFRIEPK